MQLLAGCVTELRAETVEVVLVAVPLDLVGVPLVLVGVPLELYGRTLACVAVPQEVVLESGPLEVLEVPQVEEVLPPRLRHQNRIW